MRIKTRIEAIEKKLTINKEPFVLVIGRKQSWDTIAPEEHEKLDSSEWVTIKRFKEQHKGKQCCLMIGASPQAEIQARKELGIW